MKTHWTSGIALALLLLSGCADGTPEAAIEKHLEATRASDGQAFCESLSEDGKDAYQSLFGGLDRTCGEVFESVPSYTRAAADGASSIDVREVTVNGSGASAILTAEGPAETTVELVDEGGWKVDTDAAYVLALEAPSPDRFEGEAATGPEVTGRGFSTTLPKGWTDLTGRFGASFETEYNRSVPNAFRIEIQGLWSPDPAAVPTVLTGASPLGKRLLTEYAKASIRLSRRLLPSFELVKPPNETTLAGVPAVAYEYEAEPSVPVRVRVILAKRGSEVVGTSFTAPPAEFDDFAAEFQPSLDSWQWNFQERPA